jgi:hypothetical protein
MADRVQGAIANLSTSASNASDNVTEIFAFNPVPFQVSRIIILLDCNTEGETVTSA